MDKLAKENTWFCDYTETGCKLIPDDIKEFSKNDTGEAEVYIAPEVKANFELSQLAPTYEKINSSLMENHSGKNKDNSQIEGENGDKSQYCPAGILSQASDDEEITNMQPENNTHIRGNIFGTAMHRTFELVVNRFINEGKNQEKLKEYVLPAINQAVIEGYDDMGEYIENYKTRLGQMFDEFLKDTALIDKISSAKTVYTELPFSFFIDENEASELTAALNIPIAAGTWVNGTADLVLVNPDDSITVIDYKSNRNKNKIPNFKETLEIQYKGQFALYVFAMKKLIGAKNVKTNIVNYQTKR